MIDFRYHLVSLISIFLALAVGIVLGAGPLKEDIGTTLGNEVERLRADKTALRTELDAASKGLEARDTFGAVAFGAYLSERLSTRSVAVVVLPGADTAVVEAVSDSLSAAGATVTTTATVTEDLLAAGSDKASARQQVAEELAGTLEVATGTEEGGPELVDRVLAAALARGGTGTGATPTTSPTNRAGNRGLPAADPLADEAVDALGALGDAGLIEVDGEPGGRAEAVVAVGGPVSGADEDERTRVANALAFLLTALDRGSVGSVLATAGTVGADQLALESVVRAESPVNELVSTVDDAAVPLGQATVVLTLQEQLAGGVGHYGLASDAQAAYPELSGT